MTGYDNDDIVTWACPAGPHTTRDGSARGRDGRPAAPSILVRDNIDGTSDIPASCFPETLGCTALAKVTIDMRMLTIAHTQRRRVRAACHWW